MLLQRREDNYNDDKISFQHQNENYNYFRKLNKFELIGGHRDQRQQQQLFRQSHSIQRPTEAYELANDDNTLIRSLVLDHQQHDAALSAAAAATTTPATTTAIQQLSTNLTATATSIPSEITTLRYNLSEELDYCNAAHITHIGKLFYVAQEDKERAAYVIGYVGPVLIVICLISIMFNAILITISRQSSSVNKSQVLLLSLNLAITDLISTTLNGFNVFLNTYLSTVHGRILLSTCQALIFEALRGTAMIASALHLLALAFVHYRGTVNPVKSR